MKPNLSATDVLRRKSRRFVLIALGVAALAFVAIAAGGINDNLVYYWTPADLHAAGGKAYGATIRLGGMVAPGSIRHHRGTTGVEFDVKDAKAIVHVKSSGVPPQMFRDNIGVVVEGTMTRGGTFECHRLMVSHSNEYRAPKGEHPTNGKELEKLMRTTEGL
ncbi:MAG TPA: cytochrome c maturation protein CcmE [Thermoanaerobaculia bacterium]